MKIWIPHGTVVSVDEIARVTLQFHRQEDAERFAEFLRYVDNMKDGEELIINRPKETKQ